jgi:hypothetical protein
MISKRSKNPANIDLQGFCFSARCQKTPKFSKSWCVIRAGKTFAKYSRSIFSETLVQQEIDVMTFI